MVTFCRKKKKSIRKRNIFGLFLDRELSLEGTLRPIQSNPYIEPNIQLKKEDCLKG